VIIAWLPIAWITGLGLVFDILGAAVLVWPLIVPENWAAAHDEKASAKKKVPPARIQFLREGSCARWGLFLLIVGFIFQLVGALRSK
jgi:hypothetical protein